MNRQTKILSILMAMLMLISIVPITAGATSSSYTTTDEESACVHDYKSQIVLPNCTKHGYTTYTCSYCNDTYYRDITPATGHNYIATITAPTCTEQGYTTYTCACGDTYVDEFVDATGHSPASDVEENYVAPTCIKSGKKDIVTYCSVCNEEISRVTEKIPATGHNYVDGKCTGCGVEDVYYYNGTFRIETPSRTEIRHRDGIKLHTKIDGNAPSGSYVVWTADNDNFITTKINNGQSLKIVSDNRGTTVFTATLYSNEGKILDTASIEMKSKAGFFDKIGSFFRSLFNNTEIYEY